MRIYTKVCSVAVHIYSVKNYLRVKTKIKVLILKIHIFCELSVVSKILLVPGETIQINIRKKWCNNNNLNVV